MRRAVIGLLIVLAAGTVPSGATFSNSRINAQTFGAASDFVVHVDMRDPGSPRAGTVTLEADASETAGGTITQVVFETSPAGAGTWTTACTDNAGPTWSCGWPTTGSSTYDVRARATSSSGYSRTSAPWTNLVVDNSPPSATFAGPSAWFRGTIPLSVSNVSGGGGSVTSVSYEYKTSAGTTWSAACSSTASPAYSCNFNTAGLTNGTAYDFRATLTNSLGTTAQYTATGARPDNANPTGGLVFADPYLTGTETLGTTAGDAHSGVASITVQYAPTGTSTWSTACIRTTTSPWSCDWNTTTVTSQVYDLRVVITDVAGNSLTSATLANKRVDNVIPTTTLNAVSSPLSGTVGLGASASDSGSGVQAVSFQRSLAGAAAWTEICSDPTSTYTCSFVTTGVPDALYDLRTVATDNAGNQSLESVQANRRVDNNVPSPSDVQTADGGGTPGVIQTGDTMTLTYSEQIDPGTIISGWNGTGSQSIYIRLAHHNQGDRLLVYNSANSAIIPLASSPGVVLEEDYVPSSDAVFTGTLTQNGASFTVTMGTKTAGNVNATAPPASTMVWTPSNAARDFVAKACTTGTRTETGAADREF